MKNNLISVIFWLVILTGCSLHVENLDILDRIPYEAQKGYIQFQSAVDLANSTDQSQKTSVQKFPNAINKAKYLITKIEFDNEVPIYEMPDHRPSR